MSHRREERSLILVHGEGRGPYDSCAKTVRIQKDVVVRDRQSGDDTRPGCYCQVLCLESVL